MEARAGLAGGRIGGARGTNVDGWGGGFEGGKIRSVGSVGESGVGGKVAVVTFEVWLVVF